MGGKNKAQTVGYWYKVLYHAGLGAGPVDAFLEFRGGDKTAWQGELTSSGTISINAPNLWGGEKDQGGIVGDVDVMFGEATQAPNAYLLANLGSQVPAWRGLATLVFKGGKYGAMNPYPQKASYKIRKIQQGWDAPGCWYPEKASIQMGQSYGYDADGWRYKVEAPGSSADYSAPEYDDSGWLTGPGGFGSGGIGAGFGVGTFIPAGEIGKGIWLRRELAFRPGYPIDLEVYHDDGAWLWFNGVPIALTPTENYYRSIATIPADLVLDSNVVALKVLDSVPGGTPDHIYAGMSLSQQASLVAMNPAHVLYYARTHDEIGREPVSNMNDASYQAAADQLYAEGFGICTEYDPQSESLEEFEQRICRLIGGSVSRSLVDGQYYLDLARGDYLLEDLPILRDDDILDFSEQPSTLDGAINSVSVKYFDPDQKTSVMTAPVQALALIDAFGTIHQAMEYPEIPVALLAARLADRDLRAAVTPTRAFELTTTRAPSAWRPNQYFRLQAPKRGIADMVCILGEKQNGTLRSGAIRVKAAQDIYGLPATSFIEIERGVDTRPSQVPQAIVLQHAFEAPYLSVVRALTRADLAVLPEDVGYLLTVAADPAVSRDYTLIVAPGGGDYGEAAVGEWCPTALMVEGDDLGGGPPATVFTLAGGVLLDQVEPGAVALWGDELCRVAAIDTSTGAITLGRGCGDTVPKVHAPSSRIWFFEGAGTASPEEYTDGESISVKLLTNTGSRQLDMSAATPITLTFAQRQFRPYPPAHLLLNGDSYPASVTGAVDVSWRHRDRVVQADQLVDQDAASIGPEAGTTYTVRYYFDDVLSHTSSGVSGTSDSYVPAITVNAYLRVEVEAVRGGVASWQALSHSCPWIAPLSLSGELPDGTLGTPYSASLVRAGGVAPFTYDVSSGTLPPGLSLDPSTGEVSGTPTV